MLFLLLTFTLSSSSLILQSPSQIAGTKLPSSVSTFSPPAHYPIYGKIIQIIPTASCSLSGDIFKNFILITSVNSCPYENIVLSAESQGASLVIFTISQLTPILPFNQDLARTVGIPTIGITVESSSIITSQLPSSIIWATYSYDLNQAQGTIFTLVLSGNYSLDYKMYNEIIYFIGNTTDANDYLQLQISYLNSTDPLVVASTDCYNFQGFGNVCMQSMKGVTGFQKMNNTINLYSFFYSSSLNAMIILSKILQVYQNCQEDYSFNCLYTNLNLTGTSISLKIQNSSFVNNYTQAPYYNINGVQLYKSSYFLYLAYLSNLLRQEPYGRCSPACSNDLLINSQCDLACNFTQCGYDNLKCITNNACFNFLIGDGQCDKQCPVDTDCLYCSPGCSYQSMTLGFCPFSCSSSCFSKCSQSTWCSPGCAFSDLDSGLCSSYCTESCMGRCNRNVWCSPGCAFSDLKTGNCSSLCSSECLRQCNLFCAPGCSLGSCPFECGSCFSKCDSSVYCSPGCKYSDLNDGICSSNCSSSCLAYCRNVSDICSSGCYFSDLFKGNCSSVCSNQCMAFCNNSLVTCSPGCLYSDWQNGYCSTLCTDECMKNCTAGLCSKGCSYSSMALGFCPASCSVDCFNNCDKNLYCNPGCKYLDWDQNIVSPYCSEDCASFFYSGCYSLCGANRECSQTCPDRCCLSQSKNKNNVKLLAILIPISGVVSICIIVIIIIYFIRKARRINVLRNIHLNLPSRVQHESLDTQVSPLNTEAVFIYPVEFEKSLNFIGEPICTIDITEFKEQDLVVVCPCFHVFHPECLNEWMNSLKKEKKCPNCNYSLEKIKVALK